MNNQILNYFSNLISHQLSPSSVCTSPFCFWNTLDSFLLWNLCTCLSLSSPHGSFLTLYFSSWSLPPQSQFPNLLYLNGTSYVTHFFSSQYLGDNCRSLFTRMSPLGAGILSPRPTAIELNLIGIQKALKYVGRKEGRRSNLDSSSWSINYQWTYLCCGIIHHKSIKN